MPTYQHQCSCGVRFEATRPVASAKASVPCPSCKKAVLPSLPATVASTFRKDVTGPGPQNTGIHDLDTHIDRVIGQSAAQGWGIAQRRDSDKQAVLRANPGTERGDLGRNTDGSYRVLAPKERKEHDTVFERNNQIVRKHLENGGGRQT